MKAIVLLFVAGALSLASCSQEMPASKVPSVVQNTVQTKFANAVNKEWEKKGNYYEVEFDMDKIDYKAHIDSSGKLLIYKRDIGARDLPAAITSIITQQYAEYEIDDADQLEKDGVTYYQVELDARGKKDQQLVFTADGKPAGHISYML